MRMWTPRNAAKRLGDRERAGPKTDGNRGRPSRREPAGFWGWIGQSLSQLQEALRGPAGPWQGP